jgi:hypothetical protein
MLGPWALIATEQCERGDFINSIFLILTLVLFGKTTFTAQKKVELKDF